ncbi:MAG: gliding motility protein GldL [Flavobacteriales bacterium]
MRPGSKKWKNFMAKLYGIGAAVVIVGAMFKIMHWPGAGPMLVIGLTTEAFIFFFSAFEPPHEDPDWTLVYPELATGERNEHSAALSAGGKGLTEQLDEMLIEAKIEPELIQSLGDGMRSLSTQAKDLTDIADASSATKEYADGLRTANTKVGELSETYAAASMSLTGLTESAGLGASTGEHLAKMTENLSSLNSSYELQLQELEKSRGMYAGINDLVENLKDSVEDTKAYKDNIRELSTNLKSLNKVYSNMLNAMSGGNQG